MVLGGEPGGGGKGGRNLVPQKKQQCWRKKTEKKDAELVGGETVWSKEGGMAMLKRISRDQEK